MKRMIPVSSRKQRQHRGGDEKHPRAGAPPPTASPSAKTLSRAEQSPVGETRTSPRVCRRAHAFAFLATALIVGVGYWLTLAPDLTLEDSGELAVAAHYAGVPHAPGYPVWTLYTWLF